MAMGTRKQRERQEDIWIAHTELASAPAHPFYQRRNELLEAEGFDEFVESRCAKFYAAKNGRPSLTPGISFRSLLIGYFEGIDSERGIAWRMADSLGLRRLVGIGLDEDTPDHSTISRTRRLIDVETHKEVGLPAPRRLLLLLLRPGHGGQWLTIRQTQQQQVGAVDHLPGDRLAGFQVEGRGQGQGDVGVHLHRAALAADALQEGSVVFFEGGHIYAIS